MSRLIILPRPGGAPDNLLQDIRSDDVLLPMTVEGLARYAGEDVAVEALEGLIPYDRLCALARRAHRLLSAFAAPGSGPLMIDGIDWNRLLPSDPQLFYFRDLLLGQDMARACRRRRFERVVWVGQSAYAPQQPFHAFLQALRAELDGRIDVWNDTQRRIGATLAATRDRIARWTLRLRARLARCPTPSSEKPIIAAFATSEWQRFTEPLERIHEAYGERLQLWYMGPIVRDLRAWAGEVGLSLASVPYPQTVDPDIAERLARRHSDWLHRDRQELAQQFECPALASATTSSHFHSLFAYSTARLAQWGRTLRRWLRRADPALIIGSAAFNASSALPFHVAQSLGRPSLALPHTYVPGDHMPLACTYLACRNRFEHTNFSRSFPEDSRILYCDDAANALSYRQDNHSPAATGRRRLVVLLTSSPTTDGLLLPIVDTGAFLESLSRLLQVPDDLADLHFVIKSHPRYDVLSLLRRNLETSPVEVFPATAPLSALLQEAWVIVLCDHYGSVAVEAAATGRPIIFLDSASFTYPGVDLLAFSAAEKVGDVPALWHLLRRLSSSEAAHRALADRCRGFRDQQLRRAETSLVASLRRLEGRSPDHA